RVTVHVVDGAAGELRAVALNAGVAAVAQGSDGALCPIVGWHLELASPQIAEVVERIVRDHHTVPPSAERPPFLAGPAEVLALCSRFESATLFEGKRTWRIRSLTEHDIILVAAADPFTIHRIADLWDGRSLCYLQDWRSDVNYWLLCRIRDVDPAGAGS